MLAPSDAILPWVSASVKACTNFQASSGCAVFGFTAYAPQNSQLPGVPAGPLGRSTTSQLKSTWRVPGVAQRPFWNMATLPARYGGSLSSPYGTATSSPVLYRLVSNSRPASDSGVFSAQAVRSALKKPPPAALSHVPYGPHHAFAP